MSVHYMIIYQGRSFLVVENQSHRSVHLPVVSEALISHDAHDHFTCSWADSLPSDCGIINVQMLFLLKHFKELYLIHRIKLTINTGGDQ